MWTRTQASKQQGAGMAERVRGAGAEYFALSLGPPRSLRPSPVYMGAHAPSLHSRSRSFTPTTTRHNMAAKFLVLFAVLALSHAALVKREAAASTPLDDLQKHAAEFQKTFTEQLNALTSSKNTQEVNKALKDGTDAVLQQLTSLTTSVGDALKDATGKAKETLEQSKASFEKTAEELRKAHPEVEQQANALKEKLQAAVQSTIQESQKLAKDVSANLEQANEKLAPQIKSAYDDFVKQAQDVQKKLHEAATKQ